MAINQIVPPTHPRALTLGHIALQLKRLNGEEGDPDALPLGYMQLYAFYTPALEAETYSITSKQTIKLTKDDPGYPIYNSLSATPSEEFPQKFTVVAPQFSLPANAVHSYYPPDGHQDESRVLPHVVFDDPHLPWERWAGTTRNFASTLYGDEGGSAVPTGGTTATAGTGSGKVLGKPLRQQVPWLAVMVFDPDELKLSPSEIQQLVQAPNQDEIPRDGITPAAPVDPKSTTKAPIAGSYPMTVAQFLRLPDGARPNYAARPDDFAGIKESPESMKAIFPTMQLVEDLFNQNLEQHKYLAHVRNINTKGMPDAGVADVGLFSLVVSHRTGPNNLKQPKSQVVHVVSIEHLDSTFTSKEFKDRSRLNRLARFGMVSLFSWVYTSLPPNPVNFVDSMINLGKGKQFLRPLDLGILDRGDVSKSNPQGLPHDLVQRLHNGYMFSRWRAQTGEQTVAINRGPLCPTTVRWPPPASKLDWPGGSNFSNDYQILDKNLGVVDISYSSAWQLGKTLAIADRSFSGALMRFRSWVHENAASTTRVDTTNMLSTSQLIQNVPVAANKLVSATRNNQATPAKFVVRTNPPPLPSLDHPDVLPKFQKNVAVVVRDQAGSQEGPLYNEFNLGKNNDWAIILKWISDKLFLGGIPAHYLITDPSHLPMESLRFFHIDPNWLDCLIDGALSTANHLEKDDDYTRTTMKKCYNEYLSNPVITGSKIKPQIPCFGFVIRSAVIKAFPDLHINIQYWKTQDKHRTPICRLTNIDDTTLLCLLDQKPEMINYIQISQPPHQQRFSLGDQLTDSRLEIAYRQLYTNKTNIDNLPDPEKGWISIGFGDSTWRNPTTQGPLPTTKIYSWDTRCTSVEDLANAIQDQLMPSGKPNAAKDYDDTIKSSVPVALEMNDPIYYFRIGTKQAPPDGSDGDAQDRQLWTNDKPLPAPPPDEKPGGPPANTTPGPKPLQPPNPTPGPLEPIPPNPSLPSAVTVVQKNIIGIPGQPGFPFPTANLRAHYQVFIYPDYATSFPKPHDARYSLPTQNEYLLDLIFSVRRDSVADPQINDNLREIIVNIPIAFKGRRDEPLLENYDGPGARMLSNLRYNVILNRSTPILQCRILPRGNDWNSIGSTKTDELSFKLSECNIANIRIPRNVQPPSGQGDMVRGVGIAICEHIESYQQGGMAVFVTPQKREVYKANRQDFDPADPGSKVPM